MGRDLTSDLTKQYSGLFEKKGLKKLFSFSQDVYKSGKLREIVSFGVWEAFHKLRLFPKKEYMVFGNQEALKLDQTDLLSPEFDAQTVAYFKARNLVAEKCEHNWKILYSHGSEIFGCIYPEDHDLYKSTDGGKTVTFLYTFPERIKSIFVSQNNAILVCLRGTMYRSGDQGKTFTKVLDLGSPISFFRFNNAITQTPEGVLLAGEYGNIWDPNGWRKLAYIYSSHDDGRTWKTSDFLIQKGTNKHVHIVKYSPMLKRVMVADGDNYKKLWLSDDLGKMDFDQPNWIPINKYHIQMGGYTSVVETGGKVIFGTDYQGGTNFLVETRDGKNYSKVIVPDPYRRSPIDNMILRKSRTGEEIWANLPFSTPTSRCLLMYTADQGKTWNKVFDYKRSTHTVWIINSSTDTSNEVYFSVENVKDKSRVVYKVTDR